MLSTPVQSQIRGKEVVFFSLRLKRSYRSGSPQAGPSKKKKGGEGKRKRKKKKKYMDSDDQSNSDSDASGGTVFNDCLQ